MTLSERNILFKGEIGVASVVLLGVASIAFSLLPVYPQALQAMAFRVSGPFQALGGGEPDPYVPLASMVCAMLYACVTLVIIYRYFEKTYSPEILYIALFVFSFTLEGSRIMVPLKLTYALPSVYLIMASRVLLFGRYAGLLSLFIASVYASGLKVPKQRIMVGIIIVLTLMITQNIPIDGLAWDSSLCMISGYPALFKILQGGIACITVISFGISAYSRGAREYLAIALGSLLVILGRGLLLGADTWISPFLGVALLGIGAWSICIYLHRVYLWL
jgi:hypothetical protein